MCSDEAGPNHNNVRMPTYTRNAHTERNTMIVLKHEVLGQTFLKFCQKEKPSGAADSTRGATYKHSFSIFVFKYTQSPEEEVFSAKFSCQVLRHSSNLDLRYSEIQRIVGKGLALSGLFEFF